MIWQKYSLDFKRASFEGSGNPYHVWSAINFCAKHNISYPLWVITYLTQCSKRMLADEAKNTSDLRKIVPWIFGFPKKKKRGPGTLLDPFPAPERVRFVVQFGSRVLNGENPVTARRNAYNAVFEDKTENYDDKTLMRWLLEHFDLEKAPTNAEEWQKVVYKFLVGYCAYHVLLNPASTSADAESVLALTGPCKPTESRETLA
jgi:hypothetical protein